MVVLLPLDAHEESDVQTRPHPEPRPSLHADIPTSFSWDRLWGLFMIGPMLRSEGCICISQEFDAIYCATAMTQGIIIQNLTRQFTIGCIFGQAHLHSMVFSWDGSRKSCFGFGRRRALNGSSVRHHDLLSLHPVMDLSGPPDFPVYDSCYVDRLILEMPDPTITPT